MRDVMLDMPDSSSLAPGVRSSASAPVFRQANYHSSRTQQTATQASSMLNKFSSPFSSQTIATIFRRTLVMRRIKLLRVFICLLVLCLFIFILWKPFEFIYTSSPKQNLKNDNNNNNNIGQLSTNSIPTDKAIFGHSSNTNQDNLQRLASHRYEFEQIHGPVATSLHRQQFNIKYRSQDSKNSVQTLNNFTYALRVNDFQAMKNINFMQGRIKEATKFSWDSYKRYAWGYDMLRPRSRQPEHWFRLGLTIVDSADTLLMMGLVAEGNDALDWIENELTFDSPNENSNCFELTIRVLAGLLSAYHLTSREKIKYQAIELGNRLLHCYDTNIKVIPYSDINLMTKNSHPPPWKQHSSLSEVASLQLEFRYLTQISGDNKFEKTTFQTSEHIHNITATRHFKLLPMYIDTNTGEFEDSIITLGARTDSYYEYLLKQYLQTGIKWLEVDYLDAVDEIKERLIQFTNGRRNYTFVSELQMYKTINGTDDPRYVNKMDHLVCFLPGTLALGYYHFSPLARENRLKYTLETPEEQLNARYDSHIDLAKQLARTCYHMYSDMGTGLAPEISTFAQSFQQPVDDNSSSSFVSDQPELTVQATSAHNILRPEFVETLFYMFHITGLPMYRHQAKRIFEAFHKYSRVATGFSPISDVRREPPLGADLNEWLYQRAPDRMESFWISETLKYLYLTFCDDIRIVATLLNNYVFNTEAHMLPIVSGGGRVK